MKTQITCLACQRVVECEHSNYGDMSRETGFKPVLSHEGRTAWVCPTDQKIVGDAVAKVVALLGGNENGRLSYLYWPGLMRLGEP